MDTKLKQALQHLDCYNGIFRQFWELGRIQFINNDPDIKTAAIIFDKDGNDIGFVFDEEYYDKLTPYQLAFIIAHECMHVILHHGKRIQPKRETWNAAADIAVHEVMKEFGFDIGPIMELKPYLVENAIFNPKPEDYNRTLEYYYDKLDRQGNIHEKSGLDNHSHLENWEKAGNALSNAYRRLSNVDKKELQNKVKIPDVKNTIFGTPVTENKDNWEVAMKEWVQAFLRGRKADWTRKSRRTNTYGGNLILPSSLEAKLKRYNLWIFLDVSMSCEAMAERFVKVAASLPTEYFNIKTLAFDTVVHEIDIHGGELPTGGGTRFDIIQHYIDEQTEKPDYVFVTTDGHGNKAYEKEPEKWNILLTTQNRMFFDPQCRFYDFNKYK